MDLDADSVVLVQPRSVPLDAAQLADKLGREVDVKDGKVWFSCHLSHDKMSYKNVKILVKDVGVAMVKTSTMSERPDVQVGVLRLREMWELALASAASPDGELPDHDDECAVCAVTATKYRCPCCLLHYHELCDKAVRHAHGKEAEAKANKKGMPSDVPFTDNMILMSGDLCGLCTGAAATTCGSG